MQHDCHKIAPSRVNPVARRSAADAWQHVGHPAWHPVRHPAIHPGEPRELRGTRFEAALRTYAPTPIDSKARRKERAGVHEGVGAFQREKVKRRMSGEESRGRQSAVRRIGACREARSDAPRRTITLTLSLCNRVLNNFFAILARTLHATIRPSTGSRTAPRLNRSNFQRPARDPACRLPLIAAFPKPTNGSASKVRPSRSASRSMRRTH